jgi:nicotinic acid mononucleotide adenylyltransferase
VDISATDIRVRVRQGLPLTDLVPEAVARYIKENGLYRD